MTVSFLEAARFWVKLGFISFGGPAGQIAIMHRELVERRRWIGEQRFVHALNFCMLLPGPEAQQLATYIGWLLHGTRGGLVAGIAFVLPSIVLLMALSWVYAAWGELPAVMGVVQGFKPVVVAIVVEAVLKIGGRALHRPAHWMIAAVALAALGVWHVPFPAVVLGAAVLGTAGDRWVPAVLARRVPATTAAVTDAAVLSDSAPPPPHTHPSPARAARVLAIGLALWLLPGMGLVAWRGWDSLHAQLYRFFTGAALVTFGGAYAVLAYVTQAAVQRFGWLTASQAMDGLALAETTPGPLVMVLQFVGFVTGWQHPEGLSVQVSAVTAALLTTWATFLPCFVFIFLGGPYIEVLRGNRPLAAALSAITAAVVGVVVHLALTFGGAVLWPHGLTSAPDVLALGSTVLAFAALYRWKIDVLWIVLAGGVVGWLRAWMGV